MQVSDDPRVGTELAGYRIESLLGWGGMSVVYLADDVYSLGCMLYEVLVGQPPFRRDSDIAVVFAHLETDSPARKSSRSSSEGGT